MELCFLMKHRTEESHHHVLQHTVWIRGFGGKWGRANLDSVLKSRDITLPTKVGIDKAMVSPVVIHSCESWTIKKAK